MNRYFYCYSYPLKEFFKKNGYTAVGAWEDVPKGHVTYILEKRF